MRPKESPEFPIADVIAAAVVMYKEMLWALGDHKTTIIVAASILDKWKIDFDAERAAFLRASPDLDPDLALAGLKCMVEHPEKIALASMSRPAEIDVVRAQRAGFQRRVEETVEAGDSSVIFVTEKGDRN